MQFKHAVWVGLGSQQLEVLRGRYSPQKWNACSQHDCRDMEDHFINEVIRQNIAVEFAASDQPDVLSCFIL